MASDKQIINMIATIKTIYPYYNKDGNAELVVKTWGALLNEYSDDVVRPAFKKRLQACKMPPTPADVIENINRLVQADTATPEQLWPILDKALRLTEKRLAYIGYESNPEMRKKYHNDITILWNGLPTEVQKFVGSKGELMRLAEYTDKDIVYLKQQFLREVKTTSTTQVLAGSTTKLLEGV